MGEKKKYGKTILKITAYFILAVILCALIYAVIFSIAAKVKDEKSFPMPFGFGASFVLSGSMEPSISTDDIVFIKNSDNLQVGDIVLLDTGKSRVLHRIISINGDILTTKGDANNTADEPISVSSVIGVYAGKISGAGKVIRFMSNPPFVMLTVFLLMMGALTVIFLQERAYKKRIETLRAEIKKSEQENIDLRKNKELKN